MFRGFVKASCPHCGHKFTAPDIEKNATVFSEPVRCPRCGKMVEVGIGSGQSFFGLLFGMLFKTL